MTQMCTTPDCGRPVLNAFACGACVGLLADALRQIIGTGDVHGLAVDLDIAITRQARMGSGGKRGSVTPLPWDQRAAEAAAVLRSTLVGWCRVVGDASGAHGGSEALPADRLDAMAAWLLARTHAIAQHQAGGEAVDEITSAVREVMRTIDRPAERMYLGACTCSESLYAHVGARTIVCACGIGYDVATRRDDLLTVAEDVLDTATGIARALTSLGRPVTPSALRGYVHRGRLLAHGVDHRGRPTYRVGDVMDVLARDTRVKVT